MSGTITFIASGNIIKTLHFILTLFSIFAQVNIRNPTL